MSGLWSFGRNKIRVLSLLFCGGALVLAACGPKAEVKPPEERVLLMTQDVFTDLMKIKTTQDAEAQGFRAVASPGREPPYVPAEGIHYAKGSFTVGDKTVPALVILFSEAGELIGFELESLTAQPILPWEKSPQGHLGTEFPHWHIHVYFQDPRAGVKPLEERVLLMTQGVFTDLLKIKTTQDAEAQGFRAEAPPGQSPPYVPNMGIHYSKGSFTMDGKQTPELILLFSKAGELIGFELESATAQPVPPWEHAAEGHPGMAFEHWSLHVYFQDPRTPVNSS